MVSPYEDIKFDLTQSDKDTGSSHGDLDYPLEERYLLTSQSSEQIIVGGVSDNERFCCSVF